MDILEILKAVPSLDLAGIIYLIIMMARIDKRLTILEVQFENYMKGKCNGIK